MPSLPQKENGFPSLGLGTWGMGGKLERDTENDDTNDIRAIQAALSHGITHIDTAELYGAGYTETLVAQALTDFPREKVYLASKVHSSHLAFDDVLKACENSLKRLRTDYLDLYYVHAPNKNIPFEETAKAFNVLLREGRIKNVGICNATVASMKAFQKALDAPIIANQSHYNLIYREPERTGLLAHCREVGATFIAWRPLLWKNPQHTDQPQGNAWDRGIYPILDHVADRYGKKNVEVALNWLINQPNIVTLVKTSQEKHLQELLNCLTWELSSEDIELLGKDFPDQRDVSCSVPLR